MNYIKLGLLFVLGIPVVSYSQKKADLAYIRDCLILNNSNYVHQKAVSYFLDNKIHDTNDTLALNAALKKINVDQILSVDLLRPLGTEGFKDGGIIHITTIGSQSKRSKVSNLTLAKAAFNDIYISFSQHISDPSKDPVLYLNGQSVHHTECKKTLNKLTVQNIKGISVLLRPFPEKYWGQNAKNGLIRIWTY